MGEAANLCGPQGCRVHRYAPNEQVAPIQQIWGFLGFQWRRGEITVDCRAPFQAVRVLGDAQAVKKLLSVG